MSRIENTTPGEILLEEFIEPFGLTMSKLSQMIGVPPNRITQIVNGSRAITADTALRLAECFGTSDLFWMNLQRDYDIAEAKQKPKDYQIVRVG
jgi:antitoxin HigA-1